MSRILDRELGAVGSTVVRPRLPSLFEPGLLRLRSVPGVGPDDFVGHPGPSAREADEDGGPTGAGSHPWRARPAESAEPRPPSAPRPARAPVADAAGSGAAGSTAAATPGGHFVQRSDPGGGTTGPGGDERLPGPARERHGHESRAPEPVDRGTARDRDAARQSVGADPAPIRAPLPSPPAPSAAPARRAVTRPHDRDASPEPARGRMLPPGPTPAPVLQAPVVRITIGRIELRGGPDQAPAASSRPAPRRTPRLSLSDYLDQRGQGRRR